MVSPLARRGSRMSLLLLAVSLAALDACGRRHAKPSTTGPMVLAVHALADTARAPERAPAPPVRVWLVRVDRVKPAALDVPLPDAPPDTAIPELPTATAVDPSLSPP